MLERHYSSCRAIDRIRALWLGPAVDRHVRWLDERRASTSTVKHHVRMIVQFDAFVVARRARTYDELPAHLDAFLSEWMDKRSAASRSKRDRNNLYSQMCAPVEQMLRLVVPGFSGRVRHVHLPFQNTVPSFIAYLTHERGLRPETLRNYLHHLRAFEAHLKQAGVTDLWAITPQVISAFLIERRQHLAASGVQGCAGTLRVFLRYLFLQGILAKNLSSAVTRGRSYQQSSIPRAIAWNEVQRMLDAVDRRSCVGKRDYALLLLLVSYGLRAREVATMQLEDLDWERRQFRVPLRKGGHSTMYPLSTAAGEAIIDYLRAGRPEADHRHLFLASKAPYVPMTHWSISSRVSRHLRAAGITVRRAGSHTLRHTCVQRLVESDVPFKVIGDYVGHRRQSSTLVYGKVALHRLRQIALGDAEEAL